MAERKPTFQLRSKITGRLRNAAMAPAGFVRRHLLRSSGVAGTYRPWPAIGIALVRAHFRVTATDCERRKRSVAILGGVWEAALFGPDVGRAFFMVNGVPAPLNKLQLDNNSFPARWH